MSKTQRDIKKELDRLAVLGSIPRSDIPNSLIEELEQELTKQDISIGQWREIVKEVALAYCKALVEPGEGVGTIAAQSIGEPGTQMSLAASEEVVIRHGSESRIVKIGEFVDDLVE